MEEIKFVFNLNESVENDFQNFLSENNEKLALKSTTTKNLDGQMLNEIWVNMVNVVSFCGGLIAINNQFNNISVNLMGKNNSVIRKNLKLKDIVEYLKKSKLIK